MFERYTEKARRVIFFARYEASNYGSPMIETEHLLLGILREDKRIVQTLPDGASESIRKQIENLTPVRPKTATSVDLALSDASKSVLRYAADEADDLGDKYIGCEHLLLALLREKDHHAGRILKGFCLNIEKMREQIQKMPDRDTVQAVRDRIRKYAEPRRGIVRIRSEIFDADHVREAVRRCCEAKFHWRKASWKPRDAIVERKSGKLSLDLTLAEDSANFELVKGGWKKDLCAVCRWELREAEDDHGTGYTNGRDWLCTECYEKFWGRPDFVAGSFGDMT